MFQTRKSKLIFMWIVLIIGTLLLSIPVNNEMFHKDAVPAIEGHYESRVYVTNTGDCYHSGSCGYLHSSRIPMGKKEAQSAGYKACSACGGASSGSIYIEGREGSPEENNYFASVIIISISLTSWVGWIWYGCIQDDEEHRSDTKIIK